MLRVRNRDVREAGSLCAHEVHIGTCGSFDSDLLLSALPNHYATDHQVSKIYRQPLVCKINVLSDVDMLVDEGGQAMFFHVASGQSASLGRGEELFF